MPVEQAPHVHRPAVAGLQSIARATRQDLLSQARSLRRISSASPAVYELRSKQNLAADAKHLKTLPEMPSVYVFEFLDTLACQEAHAAFARLKPTISYSPSVNRYITGTRTIYVGKSARGKLGDRMTEHLLGASTTYGLRLQSWIPSACFPIHMTYVQFPDLELDIVAGMEAMLWKGMLPILGQRGGR